MLKEYMEKDEDTPGGVHGVAVGQEEGIHGEGEKHVG